MPSPVYVASCRLSKYVGHRAVGFVWALRACVGHLWELTKLIQHLTRNRAQEIHTCTHTAQPHSPHGGHVHNARPLQPDSPTHLTTRAVWSVSWCCMLRCLWCTCGLFEIIMGYVRSGWCCVVLPVSCGVRACAMCGGMVLCAVCDVCVAFVAV
jgi:hypothetical protein